MALRLGWRLELGGRGRFRYGRRRGFVHRLKGFLVDLRTLFRDRLDLHLGLQFLQKVGRQVKVAQILTLFDSVERVDNRRNFEDIFWNPGDRGEQDQVNQDRDPDALTQPGPATLVFELADHLQQFVRAVVDPSGGRSAFGLRLTLLREAGIGQSPENRVRYPVDRRVRSPWLVFL